MAESAFNIGDIQGQIKGLSDQIVPQTFTKTSNGITYSLVQVGHVVQIDVAAGSVTNAISTGGTLVSLSGFDNKFSSSKFISASNSLDVIYTTKRVTMKKDTGDIITQPGYSANDTPRFTIFGIIDTYA